MRIITKNAEGAVEFLLLQGLKPEVVATLTGFSLSAVYQIRNRVEEERESAGEDHFFEDYKTYRLLRLHPEELRDSKKLR